MESKTKQHLYKGWPLTSSRRRARVSCPWHRQDRGRPLPLGFRLSSLHSRRSVPYEEVDGYIVCLPKVLVVAPSRELVQQTVDVYERLLQGSRLSVAGVYGGVKGSIQLNQMQRNGCDIVVCTPGRLIQFILLSLASLSTFGMSHLREYQTVKYMRVAHTVLVVA